MTKNHHKLGFALLLSLAFVLLAVAGNGHLFTSGKLSSSLINCVAQDRYGYIWVGTEYGLNKFDGYHFSTYLYNDDDSTSIADNTITDFLVDRKGRLWIGSAKGLMRYDYQENNFVRYALPDKRRPRIYNLIESRNGDILIGTAGFGLYSIKNGTDKIVHDWAYSRRDSDDFFTHIYEDNRGNLWQSSHVSEFTRFARNGGRVVRHDYSSPVGAPVSFFPTQDDKLLIVCMQGIATYDYSTDKVQDAGFDFGPFENHITINTATRDIHKNLYVGTSECGVLVARAGTRKFLPYSKPDNNMFDLTTSYVKDIMEDKDHNLWFCCYKKGLYLISDENPAFDSWSLSRQNYSVGSSVSALAKGDDGTTWCAVQNSGVFQFDSKGKIIKRLPSPAGASIIYRDGQGQYWVGTGNALYSYNTANGAATEKMRYSSDGTYCIADNGKGTLFVSVYSKGLYVYDTKSGDVKTFSMTQNSVHGRLCNDWIRAMLVDHTGLLWLGTSNGVSCMNTETLAFDTFGKDFFLHNIQTNYLCEDKKGNILIGTDNGLYIFDRKMKKVEPFPHSEALAGKQIEGIVADKAGDLWISTTMGIWQYSGSKRQFLGHISGNGLISSEYARGAVLHDADDRIAFGTSDGVTTFYPDNVRNNRMRMGEVFLTGFVVDGKPLYCLKDNFSIPYSQNTFTLEFSLLTYKNTDDISFEYRINGGEWSRTVEGENSIPFVKLQPGKYVIEVRAFDNGVYSETKKLTIKVRNPWYLSTVAILIYFLVIVTIAWLAFHLYMRRKKAELEESKMRFLIDATHDIKSPLTLIVSPLKRLKERLTGDAESQEYIKTIEHNSQRLLLLVNQILDERRIDKNQMQLHCQKTEMVAFVDNICNLYRPTAEERNIALRYLPNVDELYVWIDRINFDKVVSNLLTNAIKYTFDGGTIDVIVDSDGTNMRLDVMDTGIGLKDEKTDHIFERFYRGTNNREIHIAGTGIGLNLSRNIVNMHGGSISAENRHDVSHGSDFIVLVPLGNSHLKAEEIVADDDKAPATVKPRTTASKNYRILVVDDDREIALYINNELSHWYRFDYSPNGKDALKKLLTDSYDLVVSDVKMPEMDGITLLKKIKTNSNISDIPVILLTSKSDVENRLEGLKKGADAFLSKPFNMDELHVLIDNLVGNVRRLRGKFSGAQEQKGKVAKVTVRGNNDALMERIMKVINEHLSDPDFNVETLTKDVGISRAQLHRKMKEMTGISTSEFIRNLRLEQAAQLIREGKINITQVAFAVGFNNQTHFSTIFKKHFGMTPTEYKEKNEE